MTITRIDANAMTTLTAHAPEATTFTVPVEGALTSALRKRGSVVVLPCAQPRPRPAVNTWTTLDVASLALTA